VPTPDAEDAVLVYPPKTGDPNADSADGDT
jgi:hypothetical protein